MKKCFKIEKIENYWKMWKSYQRKTKKCRKIKIKSTKKSNLPMNFNRWEAMRSALWLRTLAIEASTNPCIWSMPMTRPFSPICPQSIQSILIHPIQFNSIEPLMTCKRSSSRFPNRRPALYFRPTIDPSTPPVPTRADLNFNQNCNN